MGRARVFNQGADADEVIDEAVSSCPVDCIHTVSLAELRALEIHRQGMLERGGMAAAQGAGKLAARAEGRSRAPNWRAPLAGAPLDQRGLERGAADGAAQVPGALSSGGAGWEPDWGVLFPEVDDEM